MTEELKVAQPEEQPKKRRGRRTKAEIEAAKAAEAAAKEKEADEVKEDCNASEEPEVEAADEPEEDNESNEQETGSCDEQELVDEVEDDINQADISQLEEDHLEKDAADTVNEPDEDTKTNAVESSETRPEAEVKTLLVYKHPSENSPAKKRLAAFKAVGTLNGFVSVEYVKPGFGVVTGYVKPEHF